MIAVRSKQILKWGALDLPLFGITADWGREQVDPPLAWSLAIDPERLWFVASHGQPASIHPKARPSRFLPELWQYDVAELFLGNPDTGSYFEFNLAPNGAWWSCQFSAARVRTTDEDEAFPGIETHGELAADGTWVAAMSLPVAELERLIGFGPTTTANATFIIGSPDQRFLTVSPLPGTVPDFHQPSHFPTLRIHDGDLPTPSANL